MLATGLLYSDSNERVVATATLDEASDPGFQSPREIAVSPDGSGFAVITDRGVNVGRILRDPRRSDVVIELATRVPLIQFTDPVDPMNRPLLPVAAAAWANNQAVTVLVGPNWSTVQCNPLMDQHTFTVDISVDGTVGEREAAPDKATDVAYAPDGVARFAVPCGEDAGVRMRTGAPDVAGKGISRLLVANGRVFAVPGVVSSRRTDPGAAAGFSAQLLSYAVGEGHSPIGKKTVYFDVEPVFVPFGGTPNNSPLIPLKLSEVIAYGLAASPDGSHVVMTTRAQYAQSEFRFDQVPVDGIDAGTIHRIELSVTRDVYRVTEIDATNGGAPFNEKTIGIEDTGCKFDTFDCDAHGCEKKTFPPCSATTSGFRPGGLSLTFGSY